MRITESKLRSIIRSVISESYGMTRDGVPIASMWGDYDDLGRPVSRDQVEYMGSDPKRSTSVMANACMKMPIAKLFDMCLNICESNESMVKHCVELRACRRRGDEDGCRRCLDKICKCRICKQICCDFCL